MRWLKVAKLIWAFPCSAIGLAFAAVLLSAGGKARWSSGALEVTYRPSRADCGERARSLPFRGIVFGHVILAVTDEELETIGPHERVHVAQYERWGLLLFLAYGASSLWQLLNARSPYWHNHFEIQARALSEARRTEGVAMNLTHLHLHVRKRAAAETFYGTWLGMRVARRGESLTFMTDDRGFDLALMDDMEPGPMPAWFHFGCRLATAQAVLDLHRRMSRSGVTIRKALYEDESLVSFRCADPDGYAIEIYWEAKDAVPD